jgi:hypothetical protein
VTAGAERRNTPDTEKYLDQATAGSHCGPRNTATIIGAWSAMPTGTGNPTSTMTANELTKRRADAFVVAYLREAGSSARRRCTSSVVARVAISEENAVVRHRGGVGHSADDERAAWLLSLDRALQHHPLEK